MKPGFRLSGRALALAALVAGACAIGTAPALVRLAQAEGAGPTAAAFWRMTLALPGLALWAWLDARRGVAQTAGPPAEPRRAIWLALVAGLLFAGDLATWHYGILHTTAANAALLPNLTPLLVALAGWLLWKEVLGPRLLAGLAGALAGAVLLALGHGGLGDGAATQSRLLGDALCALTALWYAGYLLVVKAARGRLGAGLVMLLASLSAAPPLLLLAFGFGEPLAPRSAIGWIWLVLLGALVHVAGQGGIAFGIGRLPASLASVVILAQPAAAALLGYLVFAETLSWAQVLGAGLVVAGVWLASRPVRAPAPS